MADTDKMYTSVAAEKKKMQLLKGEFDAVKNNKADKATTLAGYGIQDAYTKTEVNGLVDTPHQNYVTVQSTAQTTDATDVLPASGQAADTIYRVSNWDGSANNGAGAFDVTKYSEYAWDDASNPNKYVFLCVKTQVGEIFDISVYNNNATYPDLATALGTNGANVPQEIRRGGMSVKYVCSSDNKYVQYRYMSSSTATADFTNESNWELDVTKKTLSDDFLGLLSEIKNYRTKNYSILENGKFATTASHDHAVIPVHEGEIYYLIGDSANCRYAFATSDESSSGGDIPLVSGTSVISMLAIRQYYKVIIPQGCAYLLFNARVIYNARCFKHYDSIEETCNNDIYFNDEKPVNSIAVDKNLSVFCLPGNGNTGVVTPIYSHIKPGNKYRMWLKNPAVAVDGITYTDAAHYRFLIVSVNSSQEETNLIRVDCTSLSSPLNDFYDFTLPADSVGINLKIRCAIGSSLNCYLQDITMFTQAKYDLENIETEIGEYSFISLQMIEKPVKNVNGVVELGNSTTWKHSVLNVQEGDKITIRSYGSNSSPSNEVVKYLVCDNSLNVVYTSDYLNSELNEYDITIPTGGSYLYLNTYNQAASYILEYSLRGKVDEIVQAMSIENTGLTASISMFAKIGIIGASWDSGYFYSPSNVNHEDFDYSWLANACRKNGNKAYNFARHSFTTKHWLGIVDETGDYSSYAQYGIDKLQQMQDGEYVNKCNLYVINFLGNDSEFGMEYLGTIEDINVGHPENNADSYYGNYARIIEAILGVNPNCRIICSTYCVAGIHSATRFAFMQAVDNIAQLYGLARLKWDEDDFYASLYGSNIISDHPSITQLSGMALSFERCFSRTAEEYKNYFNAYYEPYVIS